MKRRADILGAPAMNGDTGRIRPTNRRMKIVLPPWAAKNRSTCSRRWWLIPTFGPWQTRNSRPSRRPGENECQVPGERARPHDRDQRDQLDLTVSGAHLVEDHRQLPRGDQADPRAGLQKRQPAHQHGRCRALACR